MPANILDKFKKAYNSGNPNVARVTVARTALATTLTCDNLAGWPTDTGVSFSTYKINTSNAVIAGSQTDWAGIVSGNTIGTLTRITGATDSGSAIGDVVEMNPTGKWATELMEGILVSHGQDGTLNDGVVTTTAKLANGIVTKAKQDTAAQLAIDTGWNLNTGITTVPAPNTVTANGQRSYNMVFNSVDLTSYFNPGTRLRTTRTVAAPTQCTSLNGTTQYYSKTSPAGMTFTDNFTCSAWVKLTSYATGGIVTRFGTSGFLFRMNASGQVEIYADNGAVSRAFLSYQSLPLNKWVHVAGSLNMVGASGVIYIDGVSVPVSSSGGAGIVFVQNGTLNIGATNGAVFFPGKIAQAAVFSAVLSQATIQSYMSQGLAGTETSLVSAYSFNNTINDLNANANNLTANGSAVATNADSPYGGQASGLISATLDYAIIQSATFSTNTTVVVQVPEGCTIPTSGGVSAVAYSGIAAPYGFPKQKGKWLIEVFIRTNEIISIGTTGSWVAPSINSITIPIGEWGYGFDGSFWQNSSASGTRNFYFALNNTTPTSSPASNAPNGRIYATSNTDMLASVHSRRDNLKLSSSTTYRFYGYLLAASGTETFRINGSEVETRIFAENNLL